MTSSEPSYGKPYNGKPLYGILGAYIPLSVLILWAPLLGAVFSLFGINSFDTRLWYLAGFSSAVGASCYAGIMKRNAMAHIAADIRGGIIVVGGAYILLSLFRRNVSLAERFLPSMDAVAASLTALAMWIAVLFMRRFFSFLEQFESFMAQYHGEELRNTMREFSSEMGEAYRKIKKLMVNYGILFILPCLILVSIGLYRSSIFFTVVVFFAFCAGFILLSFLGLVRRELACASEGFSLTTRDRAILFPVAGLGIGIAIILALIGSSDTSLVPPETIPLFFAWLLRLLSSLFRPMEQPEDQPVPEAMPPMQGGGFEGFFSELEENEPWAGWRWVRYGFIAFAVFLFLFFMVHPLLKRSWSSIRAKGIRNALVSWFNELKNGIVVFFAAIREWKAFGAWKRTKEKKLDEEKLRHIASQLLDGIKKRKLMQSVNLFARLILWGSETHNVSWRPSLPPGEYCALLASRIINADGSTGIPAGSAGIEDGKKIIRCGELFEKALYSPQRLSSQEEQYFKRTIQNLTGA